MSGAKCFLTQALSKYEEIVEMGKKLNFSKTVTQNIAHRKSDKKRAIVGGSDLFFLIILTPLAIAFFDIYRD